MVSLRRGSFPYIVLLMDLPVMYWGKEHHSIYFFKYRGLLNQGLTVLINPERGL